jgi:uncharacterized protein (DUF58 family)
VEAARSTFYRTLLGVVSALLLILGLGLRVPAIAALGAAWALALAAAAASARRRVRGLEVRRRFYPSAFEEDRVEVDLVLSADRPVRMIEVADTFGPALVLEQRMLEPGPLGPDVHRRLSYTAFCSRQWGVYDVGPLHVVGADAFGLFRSARPLPLVDEFAVFPRVYDAGALLKLGARPTLAPQESAAGRPGQSPLYLGVRDYRPGDDLRHVHWAASARRGGLVVKEYEVDLSPYVTVFVDLERRHRAGTGRKSTLEYVVRSAASVVWTSVRAGSFVQVAGIGGRVLHVPPGRGENHLTFALYELIRCVQDGQAALHDVVRHHLPFVPPQSTAVIVSGTVFLDLGEIDVLLEALQDRGVRPVFLLVDNFSFAAIEGWPPPRAEVVEKRREVAFFLRSRGVPVRIVGEADDLEAALGAGSWDE